MSEDNKYFESKEFKELFDRFVKSKENGENSYFEPEEMTDIAEYYYMLGNVELSRQTLDEAISTFPGSLFPLTYRARFALQVEHDIKGAETFIQQIEDKNDLEYFYIKAEIMLWRQMPQEADKYLEMKYESLYYEEDLDDFPIDVASLFSDYNYNDLASKWLKRSNDTDSIDYKEIEAKLALSTGDIEESERLYNQLIDTNPYSNTYWNQLASAQLLRNDIHTSIESSEFSLAIDPEDEEALLNKANGLFILENYSEALKYYEKYNKLCNDNPSSMLFTGVCLFTLNRFEEGIKLLQTAETLLEDTYENKYELYRELALAFSRLGKVNQASSYIKKMSQLKGSFKPEILLLTGQVLLENKQVDEAIKYFVKAIEESNGDVDITINVAIAAYDNGYISRAFELLSFLHKSIGDEMENGLSYLALCYRYNNDTDEFRKYVKLACEKNPTEAKVVLGALFPKDIEPSQYYTYMIQNNIV